MSEALRCAELKSTPFERSFLSIEEGDFAYIDPPYPPLNGTAFFRHYTAGRFQQEDQERLAEAIRRLDAKKAVFMLSNADTECIRELYKDFRQNRLDTVRWITSKSKKVAVSELVITNYEPSRLATES